MIEKSISYVDNHPHLQDESSPFPGTIIPIYRTNHPRFQEITEGIIPVSRRAPQGIVL